MFLAILNHLALKQQLLLQSTKAKKSKSEDLDSSASEDENSSSDVERDGNGKFNWTQLDNF